MKDVQDTLVVMVEIQRRQSEVQKMQAENMALHEKRMAHIDMTLSEIGDKLNGLIGFMDGFTRKQ